MAFEFHLPDIGEGVVEGEVVAWKVKVGDKVKLDQPIVEIMTDKATVEIPSPRAGTITKINFKDGEICPVGHVLVVIDEDGASATALPVATPPKANGHGGGHAASVASTGQPSAGWSQPIAVFDASPTRERVLATPATRRLARQMGVEIGRVPPTGKHGRVTAEDVKQWTPTATTGGGGNVRAPRVRADRDHQRRRRRADPVARHAQADRRQRWRARRRPPRTSRTSRRST